MRAIYLRILSAMMLVSSSSLSQTLQDTLKVLTNIEKGNEKIISSDYLKVSEQAIREWSSASEEERSIFVNKMLLVHFRRAEILAKYGNFESAYNELAEEGILQKQYGRRIEVATKSPDLFFQRLIELQALITANIGKNPLVLNSDYLFRREGDGFIAARLEPDNEVSGFRISTIAENEALALVHRIDEQDGKYVASAQRWIIGPKGTLGDMIESATREVFFDLDGKMTIREITPRPKHAPKNEVVPPKPLSQPMPDRSSISEAPAVVEEIKPKQKNFDSYWIIGGAIVICLAIAGMLMSGKKKKA